MFPSDTDDASEPHLKLFSQLVKFSRQPQRPQAPISDHQVLPAKNPVLLKPLPQMQPSATVDAPLTQLAPFNPPAHIQVPSEQATQPSQPSFELPATFNSPRPLKEEPADEDSSEQEREQKPCKRSAPRFSMITRPKKRRRNTDCAVPTEVCECCSEKDGQC